MTRRNATMELYEKEKYNLDRERTSSGVYLSKSAAVFSVLCLLVIVVALGLMLWYLPDRSCHDERLSTTGSSSVPTQIPTSPSTTRDPNIIWDDPRLPDTLLPLHYDLQMKTDLDNFTFHGKIAVSMLCKRATDLLVLNSNKLEILRETARLEGSGGSGGIPGIVKITVDAGNQYVNVVFDRNLEENMQYKFTVEFAGSLNDNIKGYYRSSYSTPGGKRWLAVTFFSPTNARMAFPCFDDPGLKANLTLTMIHAEGYTALGNMPVEGATTSPDADGWVTTRFATSPKIATYLVCFAVLDFEHVDITSKHNVTTGQT